MRIKLLLFTILISVFCQSVAISMSSIDVVRRNYAKAVISPELTDQLYQQLIDSKSKDALTMAYIATFSALKAKHAWNPYAKITYLNSFNKQINQAVQKQPENLEIRFLRLSVQVNIPTYLGYSGNLSEDKHKILSLIKSQKFTKKDAIFIQWIINYMQDTNQLSIGEVKNINLMIL